MPPKQSANLLPPKEQNLFKSVVRFYETKQLKKALKAADTILKRFPQHGETLAMKGLTLNALEKKAEATDLVRKGLRMDMTSHICWHVYGLLYRSERDYREAAKAYLHALKYDKDNQQILRDLALLQVQIRDYDGLEDTRRRLLTVRPNQRNNWIGFALSFHLLGNYGTAVSVLDTYQETLKQSSEPEDRYETSELLLYKNFILEESAQYEAALSHLDQNTHRIVDHLASLETRARLLFALSNFDHAAIEIEKLLAINPDNHVYIRALMACQVRASYPNGAINGININTSSLTDESCSFSGYEKAFGLKKIAMVQRRIIAPLPPIHADDDVNTALKVCDRLLESYPYSRSSSRIALDILPSGRHPQFMPRIDAYVRPFLRKGIPSLFSDVKPLYDDPSKAEMFGQLFSSYRLCLENKENARLPPRTPKLAVEHSDGAKIESKDDNQEEPQCTLLWVLHFLAQHYDRLGQRELALETIQKAIEHTPTTIECYLVKARILKHCGDLSGAVDVANESRNMDLADRYLNTKCSKYGLRADRISEAEGWVGLFTRDGDSGGPQALYDMQCMWFELEAAESHLRQGQFPQALKKFTAVERHFADMIEDQFDFHSYCLRKVTLRAYVSLLRFEDTIRSHPYYARCTAGLVRCLLKFHDMPERERLAYMGENADIIGFADMTDAERKKAVSKRKKQLAKKSNLVSGGGKSSSKTSGKGSGKGSAKGSGKGSAKVFGKGKSQEGGKGPNKSQVNDPDTTSSKVSDSSNTQNSHEGKQKGSSGWMDNDPQGIEHVKKLFEKNVKGESFLKEASKVLRECRKYLPDCLETHKLSLEYSLRAKKYLLALRAVRIAQSLDLESPQTLMMTLRLSVELQRQGVKESFSNVVRTVYQAEGNLLNEKTTVQYAEEYLERNMKNAEKRLGALRALLWLAMIGEKTAGSVGERCTSFVNAIAQSDGDGVGERTLTWKFCKQLLDELKLEGFKGDVLSRVSESVRQIHPRATFV